MQSALWDRNDVEMQNETQTQKRKTKALRNCGGYESGFQWLTHSVEHILSEWTFLTHTNKVKSKRCVRVP